MGRSLAFIPSPSFNGFHIGPLEVHIYALMYLVGIALAIWLTRRRWQRVGGQPELVGDVAIWSVVFGIIGGRVYFDITTPMDIPHVWYGVFAVWDGGLGIWGGVVFGAIAGAWRIRRAGASPALFMDAVAPGLLMAQGIGRIGNYFNKELFGGPTTLPWGLKIPYQYRVSGGIPQKDWHFSTFQPSFLYELIFDFAWAFFLIWLSRRRYGAAAAESRLAGGTSPSVLADVKGPRIKVPGIFALYVFGYSGYRIFEESIRVDSSKYFFGLRLNMYIASAVALAGLIWFWYTQRASRPDPADRPDAAGPPASPQGKEPDQEDGPAAEETAVRDPVAAGGNPGAQAEAPGATGTGSAQAGSQPSSGSPPPAGLLRLIREQ